MMDNSKSFQTSNRWRALAPYLAFLGGVLILLLIVLGNKSQDNTDKLQSTINPQHANDVTAPPMLSNAQNAAATNGTPISGTAAPSDPFKAFLEAHKDIQPAPINAHPVPQTPEAIRDAFKAAVEKDISSANPFSAAHNSNGAGENTQHR